MTGWLRRNWIPAVGMIVAVAFVAWLGWINVRGGSGKGVTVPTATPSASGSPVGSSATASPAADPSVAQAEAAAKAWIQAYYDAYKTGDATVLDGMADPGSQAAGLAGAPRESVLHGHHTIVVSQITYHGVTSQVVGDVASVDASYTTIGTPSDWPSLKPTGAVQSRQWQDHIELMRVDGKWLINTFN